MDLGAVTAWLRGNTKVDVDAALKRFRVASPAGDPSAFVRWLLDEALITTVQFVQISQRRSVSTFVDEGPVDSAETLAPELARPIPASPARTAAPGRSSAYDTVSVVPKSVVGKGAMAFVHVASDTALRRYVAFKVMKPEIATNPFLVKRFRVEAQVTAQLDHPNIVPIYAYGPETDGSPSYSMKLVDGRTLEDVLTDAVEARRLGRVPPELALPALLEQFLKICDAVDFAHGKGVIHRDLKPANIMIGAHGEVYVMDWGLAKVLAEPEQRPSGDAVETDHGAGATRDGAILGTPAYMAPEQAMGETTVGPPADQYALGLILYEILCGRRARPANDTTEAFRAAFSGVLLPFVPTGPGPIPKDLIAITLKAANKDIPKRYASVGELAADIRRYLSNEPVHARPDGLLTALARSLSRHRELTAWVLLALSALLVLVITGALALGALQARRAQIHTEQLAARVADVGPVATELDRYFSTIEVRVHAVATGARNLLVHGAPSDVPYYRNRAFFDPATRPPDMAPSTAWGKELSTSWPNVHVALDQWEPAEGALLQLAPIRREMREALLAPPLDAADPDAAWRAQGGLVKYVDIGLENGAVLELPGIGWEPGSYDPRARPWYQAGAAADEATWGQPFPAYAGGALLLPCSMSIRGDAGELLGVVSVQISFDSVVGKALMPSTPGVREMFLVDHAGRVVVRSRDLSVRDRAEKLEEVHAMLPFPHPELISELSRPSGHLELPDALLTWQRLHSSDWIVVVEAEPL